MISLIHLIKDLYQKEEFSPSLLGNFRGGGPRYFSKEDVNWVHVK